MRRRCSSRDCRGRCDAVICPSGATRGQRTPEAGLRGSSAMRRELPRSVGGGHARSSAASGGSAAWVLKAGRRRSHATPADGLVHVPALMEHPR